MTKLKETKDIVLKESVEPELPAIQGYDFNKGVDFSKIIDSFATTGFQAAHLSQAIRLIRRMRQENCTIYLGYTSNMVTSGLRDIFRYLAEHKLVDVIVTSAGGVEEDFIKCRGPFLLGRFDAKGSELREGGINRTGNIFVPNSRYCRFEEWLTPLLDELTDEQLKTGHIHTPSELIDFWGSRIDDRSSIYYWTHKNNIPVFCPSITDGSIGDMVYFFKYKRPEFRIEIADDIKKLNDLTVNAKKTGVIILGSGMVKHHILNTNLMRNGADYSVYINNSQEFDGSDAGARPDEAVSWGKLVGDAEPVKVFGDVTILFPLVVAKAFCEEKV